LSKLIKKNVIFFLSFCHIWLIALFYTCSVGCYLYIFQTFVLCGQVKGLIIDIAGILVLLSIISVFNVVSVEAQTVEWKWVPLVNEILMIIMLYGG